jgi:hypothetical protein
VAASLALLGSGTATPSPTNCKPVQLRLPDGSVVAVQHWADVACEVASWLSTSRELPVPFASSRNSRRWFVNREPVHRGGTLFTGGGRCFTAGGAEAWLDTHRNSLGLTAALAALVKACGRSPEEFLVTYHSGTDSQGDRQRG